MRAYPDGSDQTDSKRQEADEGNRLVGAHQLRVDAFPLAID